MSNLDFFKKQAKNFFKDWKTRKPTVSEFGIQYYEYDSKFFDVRSLSRLLEDFDKDEFKLATAQYIIAKMAGFKSWNKLINASEKELLLAEILLRHFYDESDIWNWENALIFVGKEESDIDEKIKFARLYNEKIYSFHSYLPCSYHTTLLRINGLSCSLCSNGCG